MIYMCVVRRCGTDMDTIVLLVTGFLLGSISTAQIAAYLLAGIDLRERFPTISGSGVYYVVARWAVVPVELVDVTKGALAAYLPYQFGGGAGVAVACGLAAVIGHNWSPWLEFRGGRGLSPFMGMLLVVFPAGVLVLLAALAVGRLVGRTPVLALFGLAVLPGVIMFSGGSDAALRGSIGMPLITVLKRLEANRRRLPRDSALRREVLWRRFWYDRDEEQWPPEVEE